MSDARNYPQLAYGPLDLKTLWATFNVPATHPMFDSVERTRMFNHIKIRLEMPDWQGLVTLMDYSHAFMHDGVLVRKVTVKQDFQD